MQQLADTWIVTNISGIQISKSNKPKWAGKPYHTIWFVNAADHKTVRRTYISEGMANSSDWREVFNSGVGTVIYGLKTRGDNQIDADSSKNGEMQIIGRLTLGETKLFVRTGMTNPSVDLRQNDTEFGNGLFEFVV